MTTKNIDIIYPTWMAPLLVDDLRYKAAHGGRGSGKSHAFATMLIDECVFKKTHAVCFREVQSSIALSVKKLIEDKIETLGVKHHFEDFTRDKIVGKNGSLILFHGLQTHTVDSIKSFEGFDIAWLEEAQSISAHSLKILRPTFRKPGSQIWFTWNPRHKTDAVEFLRYDPFPRSCVVEVNYTDNKWMTAELLEEMRYDRKHDIDVYNHVWLGKYESHSQARVFKNWKIDEVEIPKGQILMQGADWGYGADPTVLTQCWIEGKKMFIPREAYKLGCEIDNIPALFNSVPDSNLYHIIGDSSRPDIISYMQRNGFNKIFPSAKGAGSLKAGIDWLLNFEITVDPRCTKTIDELTRYSYKIDKETELVTNVLEDTHNHVIDALRYACEATRRLQTRPYANVRPVALAHHW